MNNEERNIEALHIHIEGLQATLTKRNARISELEAKLADPALIEGQAVRKAYKKGWQDCANELQTATLDAATHLKRIKNKAFELYLQGEHK